jgi:hypothetical protein
VLHEAAIGLNVTRNEKTDTYASVLVDETNLGTAMVPV